MKTKKTSIIVTIVVVAICLLTFGLSFLPFGAAGDLNEYFSQEEFSNILSALYFQGGTIGLLLGIAMYAGLVFVIVMFIVALCKRRGWFALLDLLALFLGFRAAMNLAYWGMMNRNSIGSFVFAIVLIVMCLFVAILPLLCVTSDPDTHSTATFTPLPSTIPTVEKKTSSNGESEEKKDDETAASVSNETPAQEETKEEPVPETKAEPVAEENAAETKDAPAEEKPVESEADSSAKEETSETPSAASKDDKIAKTEEKPMKAEKKPTKTATPKAAPKAAAATKAAPKAAAATKAAPKAAAATKAAPKAAAATKAAPKAAAATKAAPKAAAAPKTQKALGKYEVYPEAGFFKYRLKANNGEILIVSNGYKTRDGAHKGIDTLVKAVAGGVAKIVIDKNKYAQFRLYTASDSRLIVAGEYYPNTKGAQSALESVEKFYKTDKIVDLDEIPEDEVREWRITLAKADNSGKGKFEIYIDETKKYRGRLLANNGQLLFATAAYAAKNGVNGALEKVQKKFNSTDVTVTCDKQGRYQFIVYGDNGSVLVMGESYKSKDRAISAAQSSKNFSANPQIVDVTKDED